MQRTTSKEGLWRLSDLEAEVVLSMRTMDLEHLEFLRAYMAGLLSDGEQAQQSVALSRESNVIPIKKAV